MKTFIDFNNDKIPIGKRKQAYVKWAVSKGTDIELAKRQANKKFGFEQKAGIFAIVIDYGRMDQYSFTGSEEIFAGYDLRKYKRSHWQVEYDPVKQKELKEKYEAQGWEVVIVTLAP